MSSPNLLRKTETFAPNVCFPRSKRMELSSLLSPLLPCTLSPPNQIAGRYISGLVALINEHVESLEPSDARTEMERYFTNTLDHIRRKKAQTDLPDSLREKFASVTI